MDVYMGKKPQILSLLYTVTLSVKRREMKENVFTLLFLTGWI